jgi:hypothetical protein
MGNCILVPEVKPPARDNNFSISGGWQNPYTPGDRTFPETCTNTVSSQGSLSGAEERETLVSREGTRRKSSRSNPPGVQSAKGLFFIA